MLAPLLEIILYLIAKDEVVCRREIIPERSLQPVNHRRCIMRYLTTVLACLIATSVSAEGPDCSLLGEVRENLHQFEQSVVRYERSVARTESDCEGFGPFSELACEQSEEDKRYAEAYRAKLNLQREKLQYWERLCAGRVY